MTEEYLYGEDEVGEFLEHIGKKRRSGRYPWGSGERPYQSGGAPQGSEGSSSSKTESSSKSNSHGSTDGGSENQPKMSRMTKARKSVENMTNDELKTELERLRMQTEYLRLNDQLDKSINPKKEKSMGKEFLNTMSKQVLIPIASDMAKNEIKKALAKAAAAKAAKVAAAAVV